MNGRPNVLCTGGKKERNGEEKVEKGGKRREGKRVDQLLNISSSQKITNFNI